MQRILQIFWNPDYRPEFTVTNLYIKFPVLCIQVLGAMRIIIVIINQGTNACRCPMPFSLFDAIFVSPKQRGIVLVLMHQTSLLYCPSFLSVVGRGGALAEAVTGGSWVRLKL